MKKNMRLSRIIGRTAGFFPGSLSFFLPRRSARAKRLCRRSFGRSLSRAALTRDHRPAPHVGGI